MYYDKNGTIIVDMDRNICAIRNNILNLPDTVQFVNGNQIINSYDAMGRKHEAKQPHRAVSSGQCKESIRRASASRLFCEHIEDLVEESRTLITPTVVPVGSVLSLPSNSFTSQTTYYSGNMELRYGSPATTWTYHTPVGYVKVDDLDNEPQQYYYVHDHLGNVSAVWSADASSFVQKTFYYPSGVPISNSSGQALQPNKYNGKPYEEMHGFDIYEYEFRNYYATIMRFTAMDPLCEQTPWQSPYAYAANNPVCNVDWMGLFPGGFSSGSYGTYNLTIVDNYGMTLYHIDNGNMLVYLYDGDNFDENNFNLSTMIIVGFEEPSVLYIAGSYCDFRLCDGSYYSAELRSVVAVEGIRPSWIYGIEGESTIQETSLGDKEFNLYSFLWNISSACVGIYGGMIFNEFGWRGKNGNWYNLSQIHTRGGYARSYKVALNAPIRTLGTAISFLSITYSGTEILLKQEIKPSLVIDFAMGAISFSGIGAVIAGGYYVIDTLIMLKTGSSIGQNLDNKIGSYKW